MRDHNRCEAIAVMAASLAVLAGCASPASVQVAQDTSRQIDPATGEVRLRGTQRPAVIITEAVSVDQAAETIAAADLSVSPIGGKDTCVGWNARLSRCQTGTFEPPAGSRPSEGIGAASAEEVLRAFSQGSDDRQTSDPSRVVDQIGRSGQVSHEASSAALDFVGDALPPDLPDEATDQGGGIVLTPLPYK